MEPIDRLHWLWAVTWLWKAFRSTCRLMTYNGGYLHELLDEVLDNPNQWFFETRNGPMRYCIERRKAVLRLSSLVSAPRLAASLRYGIACV